MLWWVLRRIFATENGKDSWCLIVNLRHPAQEMFYSPWSFTKIAKDRRNYNYCYRLLITSLSHCFWRTLNSIFFLLSMQCWTVLLTKIVRTLVFLLISIIIVALYGPLLNIYLSCPEIKFQNYSCHRRG